MMLCKKPFRQGMYAHGCGQCMPCRFNRRRLWTARLMLESMCHEHVSILTLTYDDDHIPKNYSLDKTHVQLFLKRLRKNENKKFRFYYVGEYGGKYSRPHYHIILFGLAHRSGLPITGLRVEKRKLNWPNYYSDEEKRIHKIWGMGDIHYAKADKEYISYCCSHITKGVKNGQRLSDGRIPEFSRMSLRPGIGSRFTETITAWLCSKEGARYLAEHGDVPETIRQDGRIWPLGRYLRDYIRASIGMEKGTTNMARVHHAIQTAQKISKGGYDYDKQKRKNDDQRATRLHSISMSKGSL